MTQFQLSFSKKFAPSRMTCFEEVPWYLQTGKLGHWSCCWRMALSGNNFCRSMQFVFFLFPRSFFWLTVYFSKCIFSLDLFFLTFGWQWATAEVPALHFKTGKLPLLWSILIVDFEAVMRIKLKNSLRLRSGVSSVWYFPSFSSSRHTKVSRPDCIPDWRTLFATPTLGNFRVYGISLSHYHISTEVVHKWAI